MEQVLDGFTCDLEGYLPRPLHLELTWEDAFFAYRLIPAPPKAENGSTDDYIRMAQETHDLKYIFFYLHANERYFNKRIYAFLMADTGEIVPQRFMDLKLECRMEVLRRFSAYEPNQGLSFLTYVHHFITDAMLRSRMAEENYSFGTLYEYKTARRIMQIYHACKENAAETIRIYAEQTGCSEETAAEKLKAAWGQRNRLFPEIDDADEEEPYEELLPDEWDYASILSDGIEAEQVDKAFNHLSYRDQTLLEQRNAICMNCGRVSDMRKQTSFETLAALFEGSRASGAERAYKRAVENLTLELVKLGQLHCVRLKQLSTQREGKKITAAAYAYQVDNGGTWGEIHFDLKKGTAWVEEFAEKDPCDTWEITDAAIQAVLSCGTAKMPQNIMIPIKNKAAACIR